MARGIRIVCLLAVFGASFDLAARSACAQRELSVAGGNVAAGESNTQPAPWQDDAELHDVQFVGPRLAWAVGDHGAIWRSDDGGQHWRFVACPVRCALESVCFLTDRIGWVAGGGTPPYTQIGYGVVLATTDGGRTWQDLSKQSLGRIHTIRFFDLQRGMAVGQATPEAPTGILMTQDGGKTWSPVRGPSVTGWREATFINDEAALVVGPQGTTGLLGNGRLMLPRSQLGGTRDIRDAVVSPDLTGWLVGDGSLALRTNDGGISWQSSEGPLPATFRNLFDFRTVATNGTHVWIAGSPGSVIWHSADGGQTWGRQFTGSTAPINAIEFADAEHGAAVGAFGQILRTDDGGRTWHPVQAVGRRAAVLAAVTEVTRIPFGMLTELAAEQGYRSVVALPVRTDETPQQRHAGQWDLFSRDAVSSAGGNSVDLGWQLKADIPGLDRDSDKLLEVWNSETEGRLGDTLLSQLTRHLRTWRPTIVALGHADEGDAVTALLNRSIQAAITAAADPTRFIEQRELAGLEPWQVERVYLRLPDGRGEEVNFLPNQFVTRTQTTSAAVAVPAAARVLPQTPTAVSEAYRELAMAASAGDTEPLQAHGGGFFGNLVLTPGGDARRRLLPMSELDLELAQRRAQKQRNMQAYAARFLDDPRHAAQLISHVDHLVEGLSAAQAAQELLRLANEYRQRSDWDNVEATFVELIERYPTEPAAADAMRWLFQFWSSSEVAWLRSRRIEATKQSLQLDPQQTLGKLQAAIAQSEIRPEYRNDLPDGEDDAAVRLVEQLGRLKIDGDVDMRSGAVRNWHAQAVRLAQLIRAAQPAMFRSPEVQFPLASLLRTRDANHLADQVYRRFQPDGSTPGWPHRPLSELWLTQPTTPPTTPVAICSYTSERPSLDGVLSDACWQNADELRLAAGGAAGLVGNAYAFAMIAYDEQFLYVAVTCPRETSLPPDRPSYSGRHYDADLSRFDQVTLTLDVDRDYTTSYSLTVDQRGWTADDCWGDTSWNPQWYVAADADDERWRVEVAIPLEELVPAGPRRNTAWAVGITRTLPAVRLEGWTSASDTRINPENAALMPFD